MTVPLKFRGDQYGRIWKSMVDAVRRVNPEALLYIYTGPYGRRVDGPWHECEYYGVHLPSAGKYIDAFLDIHNPVTGMYGRREMNLVREALRTSGRDVKVINTVGGFKSARYHLAKNHLLNGIFYTEADGIQIYVWSPNFDSQTWSSIREGTSIVAEFEDFFLKGTRMDYLASLDKKLDYSVWVKGEDRVIFIFNNSSKPEKVILKNTFVIPYPEYRVEARNYSTGKLYSDPSKIEVDISAYDTGVIHICAK